MYKKAIFFLLAAISGHCNAKDSVPIESLAGEMAVHNPKICIGFERVDDFKRSIVGKEAIQQAQTNWESFARVVSEQTDYEVDVNGGDVLIRPKVAPERYNPPFSLKKIRFTDDPVKWATVQDMVKSLSFEDSSQSLKFDLPETSGFASYGPSAKIVLTPELALTLRQFVSPGAKTTDLADVLFSISRCLGAKQWTLGPSDPVFPGHTRPTPREFRYAFLTFTGNLKD